MKRIFRGGRLILPEGLRTGLALVVDGDRITAVVPEGEAPEGEEVDAAGLEDAVRMMTATPARILGLFRKGRLAPGCDADIVLFDDDVNVSRVFIGGREITGQTTNHNHIHYE